MKVVRCMFKFTQNLRASQFNKKLPEKRRKVCVEHEKSSWSRNSFFGVILRNSADEKIAWITGLKLYVSKNNGATVGGRGTLHTSRFFDPKNFNRFQRRKRCGRRTYPYPYPSSKTHIRPLVVAYQQPTPSTRRVFS